MLLPKNVKILIGLAMDTVIISQIQRFAIMMEEIVVDQMLFVTGVHVSALLMDFVWRLN